MVAFVARRMLEGLLVVMASTFVVFMLVSLAADPFAQLRLVPGVNEEVIERTIQSKHLDRPVLVRYGYWLRDVVVDGFGTTLVGNQAIWPDLRRAIFTSLQLLVPAVVLTVVVGTIIGLNSARRPREAFDHGATALSFLGFSIPEFWLGLMLQTLVTSVFIATGVRIFYTTGLASVDPANIFLDRLQHVTMPILVLSIPGVAVFSRFTRAAALRIIDAPFIRAAMARGLGTHRVLYRHVLRASAGPLAALVALDLGRIFGGAIVVETVFGIDGMGRYFINALTGHDSYSVMAWLMITAPAVVVANLVADILHAYTDPRIRHE